MTEDRLIMTILFVFVVLLTEYANVTSLYSRVFKGETIWDELCHGLLNLWWGFSIVGLTFVIISIPVMALVLLFKYITIIV